MRKMAPPNDSTSLLLPGNKICVSLKTVKCTVFTLFMICYIVMIIVPAIVNSYINGWFPFMKESNLRLVPVIVIFAGLLGILSCLTLLFGRDDNILLWILMTFVFQLVVVVYGCIRIADHDLKTTIEADMNKNFTEYSLDFQKTFNGLQMENSCCGVHGVKDYIELNRQIPISCCAVDGSMDKYCSDASKAYKDGCALKMYDDIIYSVGTLSYTTLGLLVFQIILGISTIAVVRAVNRANNNSNVQYT